MSLSRKAALALAASATATTLAGAAARMLCPAQGRHLTINGRRLHVVDRPAADPNAPTVLMIHGLCGVSNNFAKLAPLLSQARVITYDRWGAGHSDPAPKGAESLTGQAALAADLLDRMGTGPAVIVGHSLGGAVALRLALDRPDLVRGLVLLAPLSRHLNHSAAQTTERLGAWAPLRKTAIHMLNLPGVLAAAPIMLHAAFHPDPVPSGLLTTGGGVLALQPEMVEGATRDLHVVNHDMAPLEADLPALTCPITMLWGQGDLVLDPAHHGLGFARIVPQTTLALFEGGHMLPLTHPAPCAMAIRDMLDAT